MAYPYPYPLYPDYNDPAYFQPYYPPLAYPITPENSRPNTPNKLQQTQQTNNQHQINHLISHPHPHLQQQQQQAQQHLQQQQQQNLNNVPLGSMTQQQINILSQQHAMNAQSMQNSIANHHTMLNQQHPPHALNGQHPVQQLPATTHTTIDQQSQMHAQTLNNVAPSLKQQSQQPKASAAQKPSTQIAQPTKPPAASTPSHPQASPQWGETSQEAKIVGTSGEALTVTLAPRSDTGFFLDGDTWTCYRRNYFLLTGSFNVSNPNDNDASVDSLRDHTGTPLMHLVQDDSEGVQQQYPVRGFLIGFQVQTHNSTRAMVHLLQFTGKRERGEQGIPEPMPCLPAVGKAGSNSGASSESNTIHEGNPRIATFPRLQFNASTHKGRTQEYYQLKMELYADVAELDQLVTVASSSSPFLVVRGRGPGHYQNKPAYQSERSGKINQVAPTPNIAAYEEPAEVQYNSTYVDSGYIAPAVLPPTEVKIEMPTTITMPTMPPAKKLKRKLPKLSMPPAEPQYETPMYIYQPSSIPAEDGDSPETNPLLQAFSNHSHDFVRLQSPLTSNLSAQLLNASYGSMKNADDFDDAAPHLYALMPPIQNKQGRLSCCIKWINRMIAKFNEEKVDNIVSHLPENFTWITHAPPTFPWSGQSNTIPDATSRYSSLLTALPGAHLSIGRIWLSNQQTPSFGPNQETPFQASAEEELMVSMILSFNSATVIGERGSVSVMQSWGGWKECFVSGALTGATIRQTGRVGFPCEKWYVPGRLEEWFDTYSMAEALASND